MKTFEASLTVRIEADSPEQAHELLSDILQTTEERTNSAVSPGTYIRFDLNSVNVDSKEV